MSAALTTVPDDRALIVEMAASGAMTTTIPARALLQIEREFSTALSAAGLPGEALRELAGPELHGVAAHLATMAAVGEGYLRHCRDLVRALRIAKGGA